MIVKYTSIIGAVVAELRGQTKVGRVREVVIDNEKISLAAVALDMPFWSFSKQQFISSIDIVHLRKNAVIINNDDAILDVNESINLKKLVEKKSFGIGQKVRTESGTYIGQVYDYLIETESMGITKFYVRKLLAERIIATKKIISMEGKTIKIADDFVSNKIANTEMAEASQT